MIMVVRTFLTAQKLSHFPDVLPGANQTQTGVVHQHVHCRRSRRHCLAPTCKQSQHVRQVEQNNKCVAVFVIKKLLRQGCRRRLRLFRLNFDSMFFFKYFRQFEQK